MGYTTHQGSYFAHRITLEGLGEDVLAQSLSTARVDLNPHQVDAALFALSSPLSKGRRTWFINASKKTLATVPFPPGMLGRSSRAQVRD